MNSMNILHFKYMQIPSGWGFDASNLKKKF